MKLTSYLVCVPALVLLWLMQAHGADDLQDSAGRRYFKSKEMGRTAECLHRMNEPSLWTRGKVDSNIYLRWTWLRTFHHPIAIRITKSPGKQAELVATELTGKGGYELGEVSMQKTTQLSDSNWQKILGWISTKDFWTSLTTDEEAMKNAVRDGALWDFEYSTPTQYEILDLVSPAVYQDYQAPTIRSFKRYDTLARLLINYADLTIDEGDIY